MFESSSNSRERIFNSLVARVVIIFLLLVFFGKYGPTFIANDKCYTLLGCNSGFFGYDALQHFVSGIMDALLIVWLAKRFSVTNLFHDRFWKNFLIIVALVSLIAVSWEFGEFCHDQFRVQILHENLIMPNHLDQPSNADTMGDLTFSIIGATLTALVLRPMIPKK